MSGVSSSVPQSILGGSTAPPAAAADRSAAAPHTSAPAPPPAAPLGAATATQSQLRVNDDAKIFASSLQGEILSRLERQSAELDKLFDAESLR